MTALPAYRTVKSVATELGVSASCVYNLVAAGILPAVRVGLGRGTIRIPDDALRRYLAERMRDDAAAFADHLA